MDGYEKKIGDQYRKDPTLWTADPLTAVDNVLSRKCVHPSVIKFIISYYCLKSNCLCIQSVLYIQELLSYTGITTTY